MTPTPWSVDTSRATPPLCALIRTSAAVRVRRVPVAAARARRARLLLSIRYRRRVAVQAKSLPPDLQVWVEVRRRYRLSHAHVQMARELGLNPRKFGKIGNHRQQPWKAPLAEFIEHCYAKRFGRQRPEVVVSVEERARQVAAKKATRKAARTVRAELTAPASADTTTE